MAKRIGSLERSHLREKELLDKYKARIDAVIAAGNFPTDDTALVLEMSHTFQKKKEDVSFLLWIYYHLKTQK